MPSPGDAGTGAADRLAGIAVARGPNNEKAGFDEAAGLDGADFEAADVLDFAPPEEPPVDRDRR